MSTLGPRCPGFIELPGMGKLMVDSILGRDYPVVLAGTLLFGGMVILGTLLADLLYGVVDPRIRQGEGHG